MSNDSAARGSDAGTSGTRYLPGRAVAVVTADCVLLLSGRAGEDAPHLYDVVARAGDARAVLAAAAGGRVLDLDALPDLAMAYRGPTGVRVLLSGRTRCTVLDRGEITELDGADVALLGEWGFSAEASVAVSVHDAADSEPTWPVSAGVVAADRVHWVPGASIPVVEGSVPARASEPAAASVAWRAASSSSPVATATSTPTSTPTSAPTSTPTPAPAPAADATLLPEETAAPETAAPEPAPMKAPAPTPASAPAGRAAPSDEPAEPAGAWDDDAIGDVEYTIGGGVNYDRLFSRTPRPATPTVTPTATAEAAPQKAPPQAMQQSSQQTPASPRPATAPATGPAPETAPVPVAPDLAGDTLAGRAAGAASTSGASAGAADSADAAQTVARLCPQNHANPPQLSTCRICSAPLDGPTVRITRPSLGVVRLSTGMFFDLDRPLLLGREPRIDRVDADSAPRLIVLPSPDKAISRSHLRVDIEGWSVHAIDLGSVNGTYLRRGAADDIRLMPDEPKMLMSRDVLVIDDVQIRFEDLP